MIPVIFYTPEPVEMPIGCSRDIERLAAILLEYGVTFAVRQLGRRLVISASDTKRDREVAIAIVEGARQVPGAVDELVMRTIDRLRALELIELERAETEGHQ